MMNSQTFVSNAVSQSAIGELPNIQSNFQTSAQTQVESVKSVSNESDTSQEQTRYANILQVCSYAGIAIMVITFIIYMSGLFNPSIKPSDLPLYWGMSAHQYALATHAASGWSWMTLINHADYLSLIGLAFLGLVSVMGYVSLLPGYLRKKDNPYVVMVGLEIIVICTAASGIIHIAA